MTQTSLSLCMCSCAFTNNYYLGSRFIRLQAKQSLINPRRAYAARITLSVCPFNISPLERLFILKSMLRIQRATKVITIVGFSLKMLHCRDPPLLALYGYQCGQPFLLSKNRACTLFNHTSCCTLSALQ